MKWGGGGSFLGLASGGQKESLKRLGRGRESIFKAAKLIAILKLFFMNIYDYISTNISLHYEFGETIGEGGFSTVYRATHKSSGEKVAVKVLHKSIMFDSKYF